MAGGANAAETAIRPPLAQAKPACDPARCTDNAGMTKSSETLQKTGKKGGRNDRLAAALRENLRRRKAQARDRISGRDAASAPADRDEPKGS